ncbi:MAG: glycosyltransferase family 2 protein, partial [Gemmataceae bacterium]
MTVAICTWNRAGLLDRTLSHLHALIIPPGIEWDVLVVNNASTDDTPAVVEKYAATLPVRMVYEPRPGITHARLHGTAAATGDIILWIDDDVRVDPQWMIANLDAFTRFDADLVFGTICPDWETGHPPGWFVPEFRGTFGLLDHDGEARRVGPPYVGHNANLGFTRRLLDKIGGYRASLADDYGGKGEDMDLSLRAHHAGLRVVYQPAAIVWHWIPAAATARGAIRRRAWADAPNHLHMLREEAATVPSLFGLPRYQFRRQMVNLGRWAGYVLRRDRGRAFVYELKL